METKKDNLRTITQYSSNLRIVLKIQERLVTLNRTGSSAQGSGLGWRSTWTSNKISSTLRRRPDRRKTSHSKTCLIFQALQYVLKIVSYLVENNSSPNRLNKWLLPWIRRKYETNVIHMSCLERIVKWETEKNWFSFALECRGWE